MSNGAKSTTAVLGSGGLGTAMARRLGEAGHEVRVWNRSADKAQRAADGVANVTAVATAAEAVAGADAVLTVLRDADAVAEVMTPLLGEVGGVWVQASTVGPEGAQRLGALAAEHGVDYLDAPVSGSTQPASQGQLVWLVAGPDTALSRAGAVLDALGKQTQHVGRGTSEGSALKLAVNAWMTSATVVMSDVLRLCDALAVGHDTLRDALGAGPLAMPYALQKSQLMDAGEFAPGFAVSNALKDLNLAADVAVPSPVLAEVIERLTRTVDAGHGADDVAAVAATD